MSTATSSSKASPPQPTVKPTLANRLLRTKEAAAYLSVSPRKLRRLVQDGLLPIVQDSEGAAWRVDLHDLDTFTERNKRTEPLR
jgi:excisionase family DNA binding protein